MCELYNSFEKLYNKYSVKGADFYYAQRYSQLIINKENSNQVRTCPNLIL